MASVAGDGERRADFHRAIGRARAHAGDAAAFLDEIGRLGAHLQMKRGIFFPVIREEVEEIPLRHEGNELAARRQVREIGKIVFVRAEHPADRFCFLMRQFEEFFQQPKLAHELQRRWMDGVAAEVAQEIGVLFQHDHIDPGAREQEAEHHPARAAADNATPGGELLDGHVRQRLAALWGLAQIPTIRSVTI